MSDLVYDQDSDVLIVIDAMNNRITELSSAGERLHTLELGRGGAPHEVLEMSSVATDALAYFILDRRNLKIVVYERGGSFLRSFRVEPDYREIARLGADRLIALRSGREASLAILDLEGQALPRADATGVLPDRCGDNPNHPQCDPRGSSCSGCRLIRLTDGRVAIGNTEQAMVAAVDTSGVIGPTTDYLSVPPLANWVADDAPSREQMQRDAGARSFVLKNYFTHFAAGPDGALAISVVPSAEEWRRRGHELWVVRSDDVRRYGYPQPGIGYLATVGPHVFAWHAETGGIYRFEFDS